MPDCPECDLNVPRAINVLDGGPRRARVDYCPLCGTKMHQEGSDG